jgi:hypothetical protein
VLIENEEIWNGALVTSKLSSDDRNKLGDHVIKVIAELAAARNLGYIKNQEQGQNVETTLKYGGGNWAKRSGDVVG